MLLEHHFAVERAAGGPVKPADAVCERHEGGHHEDREAEAQQRAAGLQHTGNFAPTAELAEAPERAHEQGVRQNLVQEHGQLRAVEVEGAQQGVVESGAEALHVIRKVRQNVDEEHNHRTHEEIRDKIAGHVAIHSAHERIEHGAHNRKEAQGSQENRAAELLNGVCFRHAGHLPLHLLQFTRHQIQCQQSSQYKPDNRRQKSTNE